MSTPQEQINKTFAEEIKRLQSSLKDMGKVAMDMLSRLDSLEKSSPLAETADKSAREAKVALANMHKRVEALEKKAK